MVRIVVTVVIIITLFICNVLLPPVSANFGENPGISSTPSTDQVATGTGGNPVTVLLAKNDNRPNPHTTVAVHFTTTPVQYPDQGSGEVTIGSSPAGALVYIDGTYQGITPVSLEGVSSGQHTLRLVLPGYADFNGGLSVTSGKMSQSVTTLIPNTTARSAEPGFRWDDPVVLLTVLGIVTTVVGAAVTIVSIVESKKKEKEKPPDQGSG